MAAGRNLLKREGAGFCDRERSVQVLAENTWAALHLATPVNIEAWPAMLEGGDVEAGGGGRGRLPWQRR
jgi:hypothetical protein